MKKITATLLLLLTMVITTACGKKIDLLEKNITGTETRYGNGKSDYQIAYTSYTGRILNISIKGLESGLKPSDVEQNCRFSYASDDNENIYFCSIGMITEDNAFPFQTASDEEILNAFRIDEMPGMSAFSREETETEYRIYCASDREDAVPVQGGRQYSLMLHDKKSNALFHIMVAGVGEFADDAVLRKLIDKIKVSLGGFSTEAAETFFAEPGNYDFSGDKIKGTETVSKDKNVDYEVFYEDPTLNETIKINVSGTGFTMKPSSYSEDGINGCSFTLGTDAENLYELRVFASLPYVATSLKETFADGLANSFAGTADSSTFSKVETDDDWRIYFLIDLDSSMSARKYTKQYNLYVERKSGVSYTVMAYAKGSHANEMLLRKYVDSVEVSLADESPAQPEEPEKPEVKSEIIDISADGMTGTETRYEDGTSDYKIHAGDLLISTNGLMSGCTLSARDGILLEYLPDITGEERCRLFITTFERNYYPLPLKNTEDKDFGKGFPHETVEWDTLSRTETEDAYKVYIVRSFDDVGFPNGKRGVMYIEDKKTNALYQIMAITCGESLTDYAKLREIVDSVDIEDVSTTVVED